MASAESLDSTSEALPREEEGLVSRPLAKLRELLASPYRKVFPPWTNLLKRELSDCRTFLDLGCGYDSPIRYVPVAHSTGVELFRPYLEESKKRGIHSDYILADIRKIGFREDSFDAVLMLDVLEHLSVKEGYELIKKAQRWARKKVIVFTPNGFVWQDGYDDNPWQVHKSAWSVEQLERLGFDVVGINGWKKLRGYKASVRYKPTLLWTIISDLTQKVTYHYPQLASQLLATKAIAEARRK